MTIFCASSLFQKEDATSIFEKVAGLIAQHEIRPKHVFKDLWISHWISTGSIVQNPFFCPQPISCPPTIPTGYNVFQSTCKRCKPLSLLIKTDLSTKNGAFTTTTKFVYIPLYKTVNTANIVDNPEKPSSRNMSHHKIKRLGIISALHEEQQGLVQAMQGAATVAHGMRDYAVGQLWGIDAVCVLSRIGKVAASMTATMLVEKFGVTHILFTGVAGSGDASVRVGDIVIGESLVQHDMDASPLFPRYEVPLTGLAHFQSDSTLSGELAGAAQRFVDKEFLEVIGTEDRHAFRLGTPIVHRGLIASGDQFVSSRVHIEHLRTSHPGLLAVEMEGAAVAQVCFELGVPFAVIRTISDNANEAAAHDFMRFVKSVAARYAFHIVRRFCLQNRQIGGK